MNILPKKRWHVRTKDNIARVRRDEAEALAKEQVEQKRIENVDREARLNVLKLKSKQKLRESGADLQEAGSFLSTADAPLEHVNLFSDIERCTRGINKEHEIEAKNKKEEYEKQIGYLTYLGQDTNEALRKKNWYEVHPNTARYTRPDSVKDTYTKLELRDVDGNPKHHSIDVKNGEVSWKAKQSLDPLKTFKHLSSKTILTSVKPKPPTSEVTSQKNREKYTAHSIKKSKKHKKEHKKEKERRRREEKEKMKKLRAARLRRELEERRRARALLAAASGVPADQTTQEHEKAPKIKPKYNSQFNPELARQNYTYK